MSIEYEIERRLISRPFEIDPELEEILSELTSKILSYLPKGLVRRIVHYGSTANGTANPESDIDIAVLVDQNDVWRTKSTGYTPEDWQKDEKAKIEINRFENYLDQTLPGYNDKFAIRFVTPHDLGFFNFQTEGSPKGKLGEAWLDGRSLYCDPNPGWWQHGESVEFNPSQEDHIYRALYMLGWFGLDKLHKFPSLKPLVEFNENNFAETVLIVAELLKDKE